MIHLFAEQPHIQTLPDRFTYPFHYVPHPLCVQAAEEVKRYLSTRGEWAEELDRGKMFGVLVVRMPDGKVGYLAAFSGNLAGNARHSFFVPPIYDLLQPGGWFKTEEEQISAINRHIESLEQSDEYRHARRQLEAERQRMETECAKALNMLKTEKEARERQRASRLERLSEEERQALIRRSQHQKASFKRMKQQWNAQIEVCKTKVERIENRIEHLRALRRKRSAALQQHLFEQFHLLNARGESLDLCRIFADTVGKTPPAGAGECALPKMLQYAYLNGLHPLAMAEFWWGDSPKNEIRHHGIYYPACQGKCGPILQHMLQGLEVEENPFDRLVCKETPEVVFEDEWLLVVNKPAGMLSVPGKSEKADSVWQQLRRLYPDATGPLLVHRLDMPTSGLLLAAKTKEVHALLQAQFETRSIKKSYTALLCGPPDDFPVGKEGRIELPVCLNPLDRPRQMVSETHGKTAITLYRIDAHTDRGIRVTLWPLTGRTHQLRVHAAHAKGLAHPIVGDELYGERADRLYLHAECLQFRHPVSGKVMRITKKADF